MIAKLNAFARTNQRDVIRFLKFSVVGAVGAVIDFGVLNLLVQLAGFPKVIANACSFTTAVISNFIWNQGRPRVKWEVLLGSEDRGGIRLKDPDCVIDTSKIRILRNATK